MYAIDCRTIIITEIKRKQLHPKIRALYNQPNSNHAHSP